MIERYTIKAAPGVEQGWELLKMSKRVRRVRLLRSPAFGGCAEQHRSDGCVQEELLVQDHRQKGFVDFDFAVILDEAKPPEFGHEQIHAGAGCADHFRQRFLRYLLKYSLGLFPSIASKQQKCAGQSLLGRVEELIDQVSLNSNVSCQHVGDETVGQRKFRV